MFSYPDPENTGGLKGIHLPKVDMSSAEVEALATTPLRHLAEQHLVETPPSSLLPEMLGWQRIFHLWKALGLESVESKGELMQLQQQFQKTRNRRGQEHQLVIKGQNS